MGTNHYALVVTRVVKIDEKVGHPLADVAANGVRTWRRIEVADDVDEALGEVAREAS